MLPIFNQDENQVVAYEAVKLDLSKLLGFRDLAGVGSDEGEMATALDAVHVKIGENILAGKPNRSAAQ